MGKTHRKVKVSCKDCTKSFYKRQDCLKNWSGCCHSCSSKRTSKLPHVLHIRQEIGKRITKIFNGVPNARKFTSEMVSGNRSFTWKGGKAKCMNCKKRLSDYLSKRCIKCYARSRKGIPRPLKVRIKMSISQRGKKSHLWKGGLNKERKNVSRTIKYKFWRENIFKRDNYTCKMCGQYGKKLNADHIKPYSEFPELIYNITNGRTLCEDCHRKTDTFGLKQARRLNLKKMTSHIIYHPTESHTRVTLS